MRALAAWLSSAFVVAILVAPTFARADSAPDGDFLIAPVTDQAQNTPIPIYVELASGDPPARVLVKYESDTMTGYLSIALAKMHNGWGGTIPCNAATIGTVRWYVQGFDKDNEPILSSGDPKHPFVVRIGTSLAGKAPSLPGQPPPAQCDDAAPVMTGDSAPAVAAAPIEETRAKKGDGASCTSDDECTSGSCRGVCTSELRSRNRFARVWFGVAGSIDFLPMKAGTDACKLGSDATPVDSNFDCTTPDGNDFPSRSDGAAQNDSLAAGNGGSVSGGMQTGNLRVMATFDYALTQHVMLGARVGIVLDTYPGTAARSEGHAFFAPIHLEARGTYIFGEDPLQRAGLAPIVLVDVGVAEIDEDTTVYVAQTGIAGTRPMQAWHFGGPFFAGVGAGLRYAISPYHALVIALKGEAAIGSSGILPMISPEVGAQIGF
ncbi:MAG TPA: hypothetical protein VF407_20900 [Polyangiaceae bacterium]